jgi:hypothetical protein
MMIDPETEMAKGKNKIGRKEERLHFQDCLST